MSNHDSRTVDLQKLRAKCESWDRALNYCTRPMHCECEEKAYPSTGPIYASGESDELLELRRKCTHMEAGTLNQHLTTPCETIQADGMRHCLCLHEGAVTLNQVRAAFGYHDPIKPVPTDLGGTKAPEPVTSVRGLNPKDAIGVTKAPLSLLPPVSDLVTSLVFQTGAVKYGPFNWRETPIQSHIYLEAAKGHVQSVMDGEDSDPESGIHHLAHARACIDIYLDALATGNLVQTHPTKRQGMKGGPVFSRSLEKLVSLGLIGDLQKVKEWLAKPWRAEAIGKPQPEPDSAGFEVVNSPTSWGTVGDVRANGDGWWRWEAQIWVGDTIRGNVRFKERPRGGAYRFDIPTRFGGSWTFSFALKSATEINHTRLDIIPSIPNLEHILTYIQNKVWD